MIELDSDESPDTVLTANLFHINALGNMHQLCQMMSAKTKNGIKFFCHKCNRFVLVDDEHAIAFSVRGEPIELRATLKVYS